jgi:hypothetical protein
VQYCVGNIRVAFDGDSAASRVLEDTLPPIGSDDASVPELRFQFLDRLPAVPEVGPMYDQIRRTCTAGLANAACYSVTIPQQANAADVENYLDQQGLM